MDEVTELEVAMIQGQLKELLEAVFAKIRTSSRLTGAGVSIFVQLPLPGSPVMFGGNVPLGTALVHAALSANSALTGDGGDHGTLELVR